MATKKKSELPKEPKPRLEARLKTARARVKKLGKDAAGPAARLARKKVRRAQRGLKKLAVRAAKLAPKAAPAAS